MREQPSGVRFALLRIAFGLALLLGLSAPASATVQVFTIDSHTIEDSGARVVSGTVQCDPGHSLFVAASMFQAVHQQLAQAGYGVFVFCDGTVQTWISGPLFNSSGVEVKPGNAVTQGFAID